MKPFRRHFFATDSTRFMTIMHNSGVVAALEIGGTKLQGALAPPGKPLAERRRARVDPARGAEGIRAWMRATIEACLAETKAITAIGVGFGGPVESATGRVLVSHQIAGWQDFALKTWLED